MCRRGREKSPFQAPLGPDSGTKTGAVFWHSKRCRFWSQLACFLARTAPRFRVPIGFVFGRGVRSIGSYTSGLRQPQVQALQGSLEQTSALCGGPARADRGEQSSSWPDPPTERNALMGIAVRRPTGAAARCASEAARSTAKASRRGKKEQTRFGNFTHDSRRPSRCEVAVVSKPVVAIRALPSRTKAGLLPSVTVLRALRKHQQSRF